MPVLIKRYRNQFQSWARLRAEAGELDAPALRVGGVDGLLDQQVAQVLRTAVLERCDRGCVAIVGTVRPVAAPSDSSACCLRHPISKR